MQPQPPYIDEMNDYMLANQLTAASFAKQIGARVQSVNRWLSLENDPTVVSLTKFADFRNVSLDFLLGLTDIPTFYPAEQRTTFIARLLLLMGSTSSTRKLGTACGFHFTAITQWKRGNIPTLSTVVSIAKHFNVSVDYLVGRSDYR